MKKYEKPEYPQTKIPGAVGSIFDPKDKKTGESIPTNGNCCDSGSTVKTIITNGVSEKIRYCNNCGKEISGIVLNKFR